MVVQSDVEELVAEAFVGGAGFVVATLIEAPVLALVSVHVWALVGIGVLVGRVLF